MTAQATESLLYKGEKVRMRTLPLTQYFVMMGIQPEFQAKTSACWRAYIGSWEIALDRLYLIGINADYEDDRSATLGDFFPGYEERVFAHWFSGVVSIPRGALLEYVHGGFASKYEMDLLITIENGVVVDTYIRDNRKAVSVEKNNYE